MACYNLLDELVAMDVTVRLKPKTEDFPQDYAKRPDITCNTSNYLILTEKHAYCYVQSRSNLFSIKASGAIQRIGKRVSPSDRQYPFSLTSLASPKSVMRML